jgi:hypothetical protein
MTKQIISRDELNVETARADLFVGEDGFVYRNNDGTNHIKGDFVGTVRPLDGYYSLTYKGTSYSGKRMAHFLTEGFWPEKEESIKKANVRVERAPRLAPTITAEMRLAAIERKKAKTV